MLCLAYRLGFELQKGTYSTSASVNPRDCITLAATDARFYNDQNIGLTVSNKIPDYTSKEFVFSPFHTIMDIIKYEKRERKNLSLQRGKLQRVESSPPSPSLATKSKNTPSSSRLKDSSWGKAPVFTVLPLEDLKTLEMERFTGISPLCRPLSGSLYGGFSLVPTLCIEGTSKGMEEGEDNGSTKEL